MARTSFGRQFVALMKRNYVLKKRNKKHTMQEIVSPIYFVLILVIIRVTAMPDEQPSVPFFPENEINAQEYQPDPSKVLLVAPNTTTIENVINETLQQLASTGALVPDVQFYGSEESAEEAYKSKVDAGLGIMFQDGSLATLNYTIRVPYGSTPSVESLYGQGGSCRGEAGLDYCAANQYLYGGLINLQLALDSALIKLSNSDFSKPEVKAQLFPKDVWTPDASWIQILASLYFVMAYAPFVNFMVVALVTEKEKKIKEGMRMMGLRDSAFWIAWGMTYLILLTVVNLVVVLLSFATLFPNSNMFLFFLIITCYSLCIISMAFLITPFFNKSETAGGLASLATIIFSLLYLPVSLTRSFGPDGPVSTIPVGGQWALCLLPPVALALAIDQALYLDIAQGGMDFDNMSFGQFPLYASLLMLFLDFLIYGLLAVYFDNIVPSEYGQRRPWYYFVQPSFWCPKKKSDKREDSYDTRPSDIAINMQDDLVEPISEELRYSDKIRIRDLKKVFKSQEDKKKQITAVDGVSLDIYEGQITCLLGHNGAGKTTMLNMLTGMTSPSSGNATVYGYDVSDPNEMSELRGMTGVCPQHNILLNDLSCNEHLQFYGVIKGVKSDDLDAQIAQSLKDVDLMDQVDTHARKLSGGQKRKLCVAIALIGDPKVIFLDEPTAGMDPYSRRHLWSLLKERRPGRVILLTTHFMDEADILADRKAFVSKGRLTCVGSSLFLKNRFGVGYHLSMVVDNPNESSESICQFVRSHIPEANIARIHGKELDVTLPLASANKFAGLFRDLENGHSASLTRAETMGIRSYGIAMTSLEEVFLKIGIEETSDKDDGSNEFSTSQSSPLLETNRNNSQYDSTSPTKQSPGTRNRVSPTPQETIRNTNGTAAKASENSSNNMRHGDNDDSGAAMAGKIPQLRMAEGKELRKQRFLALCKVRGLLLVRNPGSLFFRIIVPVLFIVIGVAIMAFAPTIQRTESKNAVNLDASLYSKINGDAENNNPSFVIEANQTSGPSASDFYQALNEQDIALLNITTSTDLLSIAPHHSGLKLYNIDAINTPVISDITVMYNDSALHAFPATVNTMSNTFLKMLSGTGDSLTTYVRFWPNLNQDLTGYDTTVMSSVILLGLAMSVIPPFFGMVVVKEREIKARSLLRISGVTMNMYWGSVFTVDFIQFFSAAVLSIVAVLAFQVTSLMYGGAILALVLLYFIYVPVNMFLSYVFSFGFDKMETAAGALFNIFFLGSFIPYMAVSMLDMFGVEEAATILHYILVFIDPMYAVFGGLYYIARVYLYESLIQGTTDPEIGFDKYFSWDSNIPITLIVPLFHAVWLFFVLRLLEIRKTGGDVRDVCCVSGKTKPMDTAQEVNSDIPEDEDEDIQAERERVRLLQQLTSPEEYPAVVVEGLRKEYVKDNEKGCCEKKNKEEKVKVAVRNNTFTVNHGDVFGLLGPNGAGKTTTLNMIIAEEGLTKGKVNVAGYDIKSSLSDAFQAMGYCPQHDALWEDITLREHLMCYAQLTGIAKSEAQIVVQYFLDSLHIEEHADKNTKKLSGGTKRKLSYALSMLGQAQVVLLDEPSTGMDPKSKRFMWDTISNTFHGSSRGAILTTHYMEEADALCSKVGIMVNGTLECLGSTQHLKSKYGNGYLLEIKLDQTAHTGSADGEPMKALDDSVRKMFSDPVLNECFGDRAMYSIPQSDVNSLADVFAALERGKKELGIEEYSFSQSTLEQVFLEFAKHQVEENAGGENDDDTSGDQQALKQKKSSMRQVSVNSPLSTTL